MTPKKFKYIMATIFWFGFLGFVGLALWEAPIPRIPKLIFAALACGLLCIAYLAEDKL